MLSNRDAIIGSNVAEFMDLLAEWKDSGCSQVIPNGIDLSRADCRVGVLPFAVLASRLNDKHQDIADLIDATLAKIYSDGPAEALKQSTLIADLEECLECLCYVGFRRAKFVSSPKLLRVAEDTVASLRGKRIEKIEFMFLMNLLFVCRSRMETTERQQYGDLCQQILQMILSNNHHRITVEQVYSIVQRFMQIPRIHPARHAEFLALARELGENYFKSGAQYLPVSTAKPTSIERFLYSIHPKVEAGLRSIVARRPNNSEESLIKEVSIAVAIGRGKYANEAFAHLQKERRGSKDKAYRAMLEVRMLSLAYVAAYEELYGDWSNQQLRKMLLNNPHNTFSHYIVNILQRFGRYERAWTQLMRRGRRTLQGKSAEALMLRYMYRFHEALTAYNDTLAYASEEIFSRAHENSARKDKFRLMSLFWPMRMRDEIQYLIAAGGAITAGKSRGAPDDSLIVLCPMSFTAFTQVPIHVLADLKGRGCSIISLTPGYIRPDPVSEDIDLNVSNSISPHFYTDKVSLRKSPSPGWKVDLANRTCEYEGINFYHTLHNTMGITSRSYDIEWGSPIYAGIFRRYQTAIEGMFDKHDRIHSYCETSGRKAKFLLTEIQHGLAHALRLIAEHKRSGDLIEIFHICNGFESYHEDIERSQIAQFQCISNLTKHQEVSLAYRPAIEVFEDWHKTASPHLRVNQSALAYAQKVQDCIEERPYDGELRFPGRPVIVLLGKILPDLPRPNDKGFIHTDVKEWFLDCCRLAHENHINLLIKPHPAEHNSQVSLYVNQEFTSFLNELPSEMHPVILDRTAYPVTSLGGFADGVILWGGNSLVELGLIRVPTMVCGYYGAMDSPVGHYLPHTREAFKEFLLGDIDKGRLDGVREKTISFLSYVLHPNHTIPSRFNNRSLYNAEVWPPLLYPETEELRMHGARMADYVLGDHQAIVPEKV